MDKKPLSTKVIVNGIDVKRFIHVSKRDLHEELDLPVDVFLIGFFGRFMAPKGFRVLVDAVKELTRNPDIGRRYVVVCFGWGGYIREDQNYINQSGLHEFFRFLPFSADIGSAFRGVDIVAMPSLWEACPLLAMESLVSGTPIVGTSCNGLGEVLNGTPAYVVNPGDAKALADALLSAMNVDRSNEFREYSPNAVQRFDVKRTVRELVKLYDEVYVS